MIKIAITGSYAVGKSSVLKLLSSKGYKVFSCDEYVKEIYKQKEIQQLVLNNINNLQKFDIQHLVNIIYQNDKERIKLESIIHPLVLKGINIFIEQNISNKFLFFEVPLLFESGFDKYFDYTICIYCSENLRLRRAKERSNFTEDIYYKLNQIQLPQEKKMEMADFTINNNDDNILKLFSNIKHIMDKIQ